MIYESIDPAFREWAAKHGLEVLTRYQDSEVRTVFVQGSERERGQIWIDPPAADGRVTVHAAVYRKRGKENEKVEFPTTENGLEASLDQAYLTVVGWLNAPS